MACSGGAIGTLMYRSLCLITKKHSKTVTATTNKNPPTEVPVISPTFGAAVPPPATFARGNVPIVKFPGEMLGKKDIDGRALTGVKVGEEG